MKSLKILAEIEKKSCPRPEPWLVPSSVGLTVELTNGLVVVLWALLKEVCKIEVLYGTIQHYTKRVT